MAFILLILSVFAAALPMMTFLATIWWLDRYEREPPLLVVAVFGWGAVGAVFLALVGSGFLGLPVNLIVPDAGAVVGPVLIAPLAEEPAKALVLLLLLRSRHFDGMTDGFVYGAAAGLGFGMTENFFYFAQPAIAGETGAWVALVIMRTFLSAVMHATSTSVVGAAIGWARFRGSRTLIIAGSCGLAVAMMIHALWNGLITLDAVVAAGGSLAALNVVLLLGEVGLVFAVFQACVLVESLAIRRQLLDEADRGHLSEQTARTLSSWTKRTFRRWAPVGVDQHGYTGLAMTLALRKEQAVLLGRRGRGAQLQPEIQGLRDAMNATWPGREQ